MKIKFYLILPLLLCAHYAYAEPHDHSTMNMSNDDSVKMNGMLGSYPMTREASGTSWQPESSPHDGIHFMSGEWMGMAHGFANFIYDDQGGTRGDDKFFSSNMLMIMGSRPLGPGTWGLRGMFSLEPSMGKRGYPLLLQTGETADGEEHLIDRQHPHDLFMELATTYSVPFGEESSVFGYFGYPGEPALGPPAFMHRVSGIDNPEAPIAHHWLDSTHITYGVGTLGAIWKNLKLEGSIFTGREPDEERWNFDDPEFDSYSARLTYNFSKDWSAQVSYGWIHNPEHLAPETDQERVTASVSYNKSWERNNWQTTFAWGQNMNDPGNTLDAFLLESALNIDKTHTFFARVENVEKDELFHEDEPKHGEIFNVSKLSVGYIYDFPKWHQMRWGIGAVGSVHFLPESLEEDYGSETPTSFMVFARVKV